MQSTQHRLSTKALGQVTKATNGFLGSAKPNDFKKRRQAYQAYMRGVHDNVHEKNPLLLPLAHDVLVWNNSHCTRQTSGSKSFADYLLEQGQKTPAFTSADSQKPLAALYMFMDTVYAQARLDGTEVPVISADTANVVGDELEKTALGLEDIISRAAASASAEDNIRTDFLNGRIVLKPSEEHMQSYLTAAAAVQRALYLPSGRAPVPPGFDVPYENF